MPKNATFPTLYDSVDRFSISDLKKWGYLKPNQIKSGIITWSRNGIKESSISIEVDMNKLLMKLNYKCGGEPREAKYRLDWELSNLGKGKVWYFICPHTGKRCRILYCIQGYFLHRSAFIGCMYESQTHSKKWREWDLIYGDYFKTERIYEQLYKKNFKKTYAGKPTKKYQKFMRILNNADKVDFRDIERAMVFGI